MNSVSQLLAIQLIDGEVIGPIIISLAFVAVPLIAILTRHQRQMAEIIHGKRSEDVLRGELEGVKAEVSELRSQLRALNQNSTVSGGSDELTRRLG